MFRQVFSLTVLCRSLTVYSVVFLVVLLVKIFNVMASIPFDNVFYLFFNMFNVYVPVHSLTVMTAGVSLVVL